ncbi:hypothetical protein LCGC14_0799460 [marine sediment metagenome]|uniref:Uncharacterized protein n=1 Tax=marine sediment metagenome TaxID=412755 RepID=A0A0F9SA53_9ZZZZ
MTEYQAIDRNGKPLMNVEGATMTAARERILKTKSVYGSSHTIRRWREASYALRTVKSGTTLFYHPQDDMYVGEAAKDGNITPQDIRSYFKVARQMERHVLSFTNWDVEKDTVEITWNIGSDVDQAWLSTDEAVESLLATFNP